MQLTETIDLGFDLVSCTQVSIGSQAHAFRPTRKQDVSRFQCNVFGKEGNQLGHGPDHVSGVGLLLHLAVDGQPKTEVLRIDEASRHKLGSQRAAVVESLAGTDDENSRIAAVSEAASAVPLLRDRLRRDELVQTQFMLVFDNELYEPHATRRWRDLAQMPRADFEAEVEACLKPGGTFAALRAIMETGFGRARLG
ncbi:hypothetical protein ABIB66_007258 [Bradyrhizobium sp. F1.13.3]